jgi:hypothetical protein
MFQASQSHRLSLVILAAVLPPAILRVSLFRLP